MPLSYKARVEQALRDAGIKNASNIIFRIEDKDGLGPYQNNYVFKAEDPWGYGGKAKGHRPSPSEDGLRYHHADHYFAFDNFNQLQRWFNRKQRDALREVGCDVYIYRVRGKQHLLRGRAQIVFKKQYAEKIGKIDL